MRYRWAALLLATVPLAACSPISVCTDEARAAINVHVVSATDGMPLDAMVTARSGAYADSARTFGGIAGLAYERAGTYDVSIRAAGYAPWTRSNVEVSRGACHVNAVTLNATLSPG